MAAGRTLATADTPAKPTILVVEDDREINALVTHYLRDNDLETVSVSDSCSVEAALAARAIDLIVLDINLPSEDGYSLCVRLRRSSRVPIIMLTAKSEDTDRILGLELGADDYVTKPFNPRELLARIRAVLRRHDAGEETSLRALLFSGWRVDLIGRRLSNPFGVDVALTGSEFELLLLFCDHAGRVLSRDRLLELTHRLSRIRPQHRRSRESAAPQNRGGCA